MIIRLVADKDDDNDDILTKLIPEGTLARMIGNELYKADNAMSLTLALSLATAYHAHGERDISITEVQMMLDMLVTCLDAMRKGIQQWEQKGE